MRFAVPEGLEDAQALDHDEQRAEGERDNRHEVDEDVHRRAGDVLVTIVALLTGWIVPPPAFPAGGLPNLVASTGSSAAAYASKPPSTLMT